jgi:thiamine pyrophosphate-dependent acetolactate synthase large subunit-like protein
VDFLSTDFVKLAAAHGCHAERIGSVTDLDRSLAHAFDRREPMLIEIPVRYEFPR